MSGTHRTRWLALLLVAFVPWPVASCSVAANLTADELLNEVDKIVRVEGLAPDHRIEYLDRAETASLGRRMFWFGLWFAVEVARLLLDDDDDDENSSNELDESSRGASLRVASVRTLDAPVGHVRELLEELPDEVGSDLRFAGLAGSRFGWIGHYDVHPLSRIVAFDGLAAVASAIDVPLFQGNLERLRFDAPPAELVAAGKAVRAGRPQRRQVQELDPAARAAYIAALPKCAAAALARADERIALVEVLTEACIAEQDPAVLAAAEAALRGAYQHLVERLLLDVVRGRGDDVEVRLCAMDVVRRAGGVAAVPLLLSVMAANPDQMAAGEPLYDGDASIRLRLVHYCGQLRFPSGDAVLRLAGRDGVVPLAPTDFLAVTALNESAYTSKLRIPALTALSWSLGRPKVDLDLAWVREWRSSRR